MCQYVILPSTKKLGGRLGTSRDNFSQVIQKNVYWLQFRIARRESFMFCYSILYCILTSPCRSTEYWCNYWNCSWWRSCSFIHRHYSHLHSLHHKWYVGLVFPLLVAAQKIVTTQLEVVSEINTTLKC